MLKLDILKYIGAQVGYRDQAFKINETHTKVPISVHFNKSEMSYFFSGFSNSRLVNMKMKVVNLRVKKDI